MRYDMRWAGRLEQPSANRSGSSVKEDGAHAELVRRARSADVLCWKAKPSGSRRVLALALRTEVPLSGGLMTDCWLYCVSQRTL